MKTRPIALVWVLIAALLWSGVGAVALRTFYYPSSASSVGGTVASFGEFAAGADSGLGDHITSFGIGTNRTTFSASLTGHGGAKIVITDLVKVRNVHSAAHGFTLIGVHVSNARVTTATFEVFNGAASLGTLDLKAASPSLALGSVAGGASYTVRATFGLADGAGANNATVPMTVRLAVTP